jgi:Uma2 family endonuclease
VVETGRQITEADFLAWPETGSKVELVDGEVVEVATTIEHGYIAVTLIGLLLAAGLRKLGGIFDSGTGFRMTNGNIRLPDVSFMRRERLERFAWDAIGDGAPDLCVEIISPSERPGAISRKIGEYFESGAEQVWLLWPEDQRVTVYRSLQNVRTWQSDEELDGGDLLPGFRCRVGTLFATE